MHDVILTKVVSANFKSNTQAPTVKRVTHAVELAVATETRERVLHLTMVVTINNPVRVDNLGD